MNFYEDIIFKIKKYDVPEGVDLLTAVLNVQNQTSDPSRFYLRFVPESVLSEYDLNDPDSAHRFRKACWHISSPQKGMCACNLRDFSCGSHGLKISDPEEQIEGTFIIDGYRLTYSPIVPRVYEERDISKYANTIYFTSAPFSKIMQDLIAKSNRFRLHSHYEIVKYDTVPVIKEISREEMLTFATDSNLGNQVLQEYLAQPAPKIRDSGAR